MASVPRAFLSYSHDSPEHKERVLALCDRLRQDGLDAWIDRYEQSPPEGWPRWMERQIEEADFVLVVCSEVYLRRFRGLEAPGRGLGANWEGAVITQELYEAALRNTRFIPVVFSPEDEEHIPIVLRGVTRYRVDLEEGYEALTRHLTGQPAVLPPELGPPKKLPPLPRPDLPFEAETRKRKPAILIGLLLVVVTLAAFAVAPRLRSSPEDGEHLREESPDLQVLRGEILDEQTGKPLPGVRVELPDFELEQVTNERGQYRFEIDAPAGTQVKLRATMDGYESRNLDYSIGSGTLDKFRMRMQP